MFKKLSKYKDFKIAIKKMWHLKSQTIFLPFLKQWVKSRKTMKKHLNKIHGNPLRIAIDHLQK